MGGPLILAFAFGTFLMMVIEFTRLEKFTLDIFMVLEYLVVLVYTF